MATVAELKTIATDLKLSFKSKITKPELEAMIAAEQERLAEENNRAFVNANSKPIPRHIAQRLGLERKTAPRNVPLTSEAREENYRKQKNGMTRAFPQTGRQAKRLRKKSNRNAV